MRAAMVSIDTAGAETTSTAGGLDDRRRGDRGDRSGCRRGRGHLRDRSGPVIDESQPALHDLQFGFGVAADAPQPAAELRLIADSVRGAQLVRASSAAVRRWHPPQQRHRDLRAESGGQSQGVLHRVRPALGQVQRTELRIGIAVVGDRRDDPGLQCLHRHDVFQTDPHRVAGEPLGVGDDDTIRVGAEHPPQREDLGGGAAASCRRVRLVGHENRRRCDRVTVDAAARLGAGDQALHHVTDVVDVEPGAVKRAVARHGAEHLADRLQAAFASRFGRFDHERSCTHSEDHAVAPSVERQGRLGHVAVGGGCAGRQESGTEPAEEGVRGDVIGSDHDDATATTGADPVLGEADGLGRARTCRVDLGVRPTGTDQVGELGVPHRQNTEQEAPVEVVGLVVDQLAQVVQTTIDLVERDIGTVDFDQANADGFQLGTLLAPGLVAREGVGIRRRTPRSLGRRRRR